MTLDVRLNSIRGGDEPLEDLARSAVANEAAFDVLVRRCYDRIHRWALMATRDPDEADDVVQETLLRMHRSLADFRGDSRFTSWVYRITQSAAADLNRRRASRLRKLFRLSRYRETGHELPPSIIGRIERERTLDLVRAFWEELPPGQRKILDLADFQGYKPSEIAEMLEMKAVTVRAHLFKARRTIRERILESAPDIVEEETG